MTKIPICVIGAGLAGLTTAYRLQQNGFDVSLYEAKNRVGGRVFTVFVDDHISELGAQNVADGGKAQHLHQLIDECNLFLSENFLSLSHKFFTGEKLISIDQLPFDPTSLKCQLTAIAEQSKHMRDVFDRFFQEKSPLYRSLAVRMAGYEGSSLERLSPLYTDTLYYMLLGGICSIHQGNSIELSTIQGGNGRLPEKLAQSLGERVHLNMPLIAVSKTIDDSYDLFFQDGQHVRTDIVVLAIPCSVDFLRIPS